MSEKQLRIAVFHCGFAYSGGGGGGGFGEGEGAAARGAPRARLLPPEATPAPPRL